MRLKILFAVSILVAGSSCDRSADANPGIQAVQISGAPHHPSFSFGEILFSKRQDFLVSEYSSILADFPEFQRFAPNSTDRLREFCQRLSEAYAKAPEDEESTANFSIKREARSVYLVNDIRVIDIDGIRIPLGSISNNIWLKEQVATQADDPSAVHAADAHAFSLELALAIIPIAELVPLGYDLSYESGITTGLEYVFSRPGSVSEHPHLYDQLLRTLLHKKRRQGRS